MSFGLSYTSNHSHLDKATFSQFRTLTKYRTPGHELEAFLNTHYGPGNAYYEDFCKLCRIGVDEGWVAATEIDGPNYRRGKIALPCPESRYISITTVYMNSQQEYNGQYHAHPYGEINCVVQIDPTAELSGMQGWQGAGWTSPGPGEFEYLLFLYRRRPMGCYDCMLRLHSFTLMSVLTKQVRITFRKCAKVPSWPCSSCQADESPTTRIQRILRGSGLARWTDVLSN